MSPSPPSATITSAVSGAMFPYAVVSWPSASCASVIGLATNAIPSLQPAGHSGAAVGGCGQALSRLADGENAGGDHVGRKCRGEACLAPADIQLPAAAVQEGLSISA